MTAKQSIKDTTRRARRSTGLRIGIVLARTQHALLGKLTKAWANRYWDAHARGNAADMQHASGMLERLRESHDNLAQFTERLRAHIAIAQLEDAANGMVPPGEARADW